ncbi:hypothetical protein ACQEVF_16875 [Nonomuraea polychroma]
MTGLGTLLRHVHELMDTLEKGADARHRILHLTPKARGARRYTHAMHWRY